MGGLCISGLGNELFTVDRIKNALENVKSIPQPDYFIVRWGRCARMRDMRACFIYGVDLAKDPDVTVWRKIYIPLRRGHIRRRNIQKAIDMMRRKKYDKV